MSQADFYKSWYCPFAQRSWLGVLYRDVGINIKEQDPRAKTPEWLAISPRGLVPALVHNGKSIFESSLILEYLDDAWPAKEGGPRIHSENPYIRFQARLQQEYIDNKLVKPMYQILKTKEGDEEYKKLTTQLLADLKQFFDDQKPGLKFYLGNEPGFVDFMLLPFAAKYKSVLKRLRNFQIPKAGFERFEEWYDNMLQLDCVKQTMPDDAKVAEAYKSIFG